MKCESDPARRRDHDMKVWRACLAAILSSVLAGCSVLEIEPAPTTRDADRINASRPTSAEGPFPVGSVTDGDTIRVRIDGKSTPIRLIGIDTPEVSHPQKPVQCFGREASARAHELMDGSQVWLEYDPSQGRRDRYGRTLAYVWMDESVLVNEKMVSEGFAREYTYDDAYKYRDTFRDAEEAARSAGRGLWNPAACAGGSTD
jgi:endonuclease YncB( thermonuclease family)